MILVKLLKLVQLGIYVKLCEYNVCCVSKEVICRSHQCCFVTNLASVAPFEGGEGWINQ